VARLRLGGIHLHANGARGVPPLLGPLILLLPNVKSVHRLTDAWQRADCAYLLSVVERIAYSQNNQIASGLEWTCVPDVNYVFALRSTPNEQTLSKVPVMALLRRALPNHVLTGISPEKLY
jgi:hypothetical protein